VHGTKPPTSGGQDEGKRSVSDPPTTSAVRECGGVRLLLVEDDPTISEPLVDGLRREGFEVELAATGAQALAAGPVDLVLLDLGLPDLEGRVVCQEIRAVSSVPIIVVTARSDEIDRVVLLELGADDYVVKPFGFRELVARIRAVLRRTASAPGQDLVSALAVGSLAVDLRSHSVVFDSEPVALTPKEYDLLVCLASDAGAVKTREQLMREVWDEHWWGSTKTLDVHVASLRRKLEPEVIETVRSVGYRYVDADSDRP
jgi:DNA-binding response OmpR family regulator